MLYQDNQFLPQKITVDYKIIITRFRKTLDWYAQDYPEIANLQLKVKKVPFNILLSDSHLNHLKKICRLFEQEDNNNPILFRLQREFCIDLTSFEKGAPVSQNKEVYF